MSDLKQRHPRRSDQEWISLIQECRTSGLSDKAWCIEHRIQPSKFYYHIRRLRAKACEIPDHSGNVVKQNPHEIVKVDFSASDSGMSSFELVQPGSRTNLELRPFTSYASNSQPEPSVNYATPAIHLSFCGCNIEILNSAERETIANTLSVLQSLC